MRARQKLAPETSHSAWRNYFNVISRRNSYILFLGFVVAAGCVDGFVRGFLGLPTILSDEKLWSSVSNRPTRSAHKDVGSQLFQNQGVGESCSRILDCKAYLVCREGVCSTCESSEECQERDPMRQCYINTADNSPFAYASVEGPICRHKPLLEFQDGDWWITLLTAVVTALSAPTGTGGGGILVPIYILIGGFSAHSAIPLSKATIFGGAVINNIINFPRRHPFANRPLIGYDLVFVLGPAMLTGTVVGVIFNHVSPAWLLGVMLTTVLAYTTFSATRKAWQIYHLEARDATLQEQQRLLSSSATPIPGQHYSYDEEDSGSSDRLRGLLEAEKQHNPLAIGVMLLCWLFITSTSMLKTNSIPGMPFQFECGEMGYWLLTLSALPIFLCFTWAAGTQAADSHDEKVAWGYRFSEGDMQWTRFNVRLYPLLAFLAGVLAGSLGIAAGNILSPFFLELGVIPLVGMATTSFLVIFTSSSTTVQYIFLGQLKLDYAAFLCAVGGLGAAVGNLGLNALVERYKRAWFLVALMAALLFTSMFLMSWMAWLDLSSYVSAAGYSFGFRGICDAEF